MMSCSYKLNKHVNCWVLTSIQVSQQTVVLLLNFNDSPTPIVVQSVSPVQLFGTPMDCSTPGSPVLHCLLEFVGTHVHWVSDAIQPSYPLSLPSPLDFNLSQHQGFPVSQLFIFISSIFGKWLACGVWLHSSSYLRISVFYTSMIN